MKNICLLAVSSLIALGLCANGLAARDSDAPQTLTKASPSPDYIIGVGDEVNVWVAEVDELSGKVSVVDRSGCINLPLIGRVHAQGLTVMALEAELRKAFEVYIRAPEVGVTLTQTKNEGISVAGAVVRPGLYQLTGGRRLVDMLMSAGGITSNAGLYVQVVRPLASGRISLPGTQEDPTGKFTAAQINVRQLLSIEKSSENIILMPGDVVSVPDAQMVYVVGEVTKPGAYPINTFQGTSTLGMLAVAGGPLKGAATESAKILRRRDGQQPQLLAVNLKKLLKGKTPDLDMQPNDVLYVPDSTKKAITSRAAEAAIQTGLFALSYGIIFPR